MQNYRLLEAAGRSQRAVLLKRGPSATMDEFLLAAEYILDAGNSQVMLCERGIRTYESHTRFTIAPRFGPLPPRKNALADRCRSQPLGPVTRRWYRQCREPQLPRVLTD